MQQWLLQQPCAYAGILVRDTLITVLIRMNLILRELLKHLISREL
jgi:hypothetical protein